MNNDDWKFIFSVILSLISLVFSLAVLLFKIAT